MLAEKLIVFLYKAGSYSNSTEGRINCFINDVILFVEEFTSKISFYWCYLLVNVYKLLIHVMSSLSHPSVNKAVIFTY